MSSMVTKSQARQLLHNKFVVILGGSVQRSMYKDLVVLLQMDHHLTPSQLKSKLRCHLCHILPEITLSTYNKSRSLTHKRVYNSGYLQELSLAKDNIEPFNTACIYKFYVFRREQSNAQVLLYFYFKKLALLVMLEKLLMRWYFITMVLKFFNFYDVKQYGLQSVAEYKENLIRFFSEIKTIACHNCLIIWVLAMPLGRKIKGGFLTPEVGHLGPTLRYDIIEANFYSMKLADFNGLDVVDLHFYFRHNLHHRMPDGIHWDVLAHRRISSLLIKHVSDAWGVELYSRPQQGR
uniref:Family with sequence similarity 113 n=1 Tax=Poecilia formosa TaxID=48698 RepID=A0A087Y8X7_POEFO